MCPQDCKGPRCRREQGFVWYSGKECPTCQCVKKGEGGGGQVAGTPVSDGAQKKERGSATSVHQGAIREERAEPLELSSDPWLILQEFLEDNSQIIFVVLVVFSVLTAGVDMLVLRADTLQEEQEQEHERQQAASKAAKATGADDRKKD